MNKTTLSFLIVSYPVHRLQVNHTPTGTNIGVAQECLASPVIFTFYTNDCRIDAPNMFILRFSDDTAMLTLLGTEDNLSMHQVLIGEVVFLLSITEAFQESSTSI